LDPTLTLSATGEVPRTWVWDAATAQIKADGAWNYLLQPKGNHLRITRVSASQGSESFEADDALGLTLEKDAGGPELATYRFPGGPLAGRIRKIVQMEGRQQKILYAASYYPSGRLLQESFYPDVRKIYAEDQRLLKETIGGHLVYEQDLDSQGRAVHIVDAVKNFEVRTTYDAGGGQTSEVFQQGRFLYMENIDTKNKLTSLTEGDK
jgi:hypothetical protein